MVYAFLIFTVIFDIIMYIQLNVMQVLFLPALPLFFKVHVTLLYFTIFLTKSYVPGHYFM